MSTSRGQVYCNLRHTTSLRPKLFRRISNPQKLRLALGDSVHDFLLRKDPADGGAIERFALGDLPIGFTVDVAGDHPHLHRLGRVQASLFWMALTALGGLSRH